MADAKKYYASRGELLAWINGTLGLALTKIEQVGRGGGEGGAPARAFPRASCGRCAPRRGRAASPASFPRAHAREPRLATRGPRLPRPQQPTSFIFFSLPPLPLRPRRAPSRAS